MSRRTYAYLLIGLVIVVAVAGALVRTHQNSVPPGGQTSTSQASSSVKLQHVFVIVEENKPIGSIIGNKSAPYINSLANKYSLATNYYGVSHPSLPNYIALSSGSTQGISNDCNPPGGCEINAPNLADELEQNSLSWKEYAEGMPSPCYAFNSGNYATKHVPFLYYKDILGNPGRCRSHVVPFAQLAKDLGSAQTTPNFGLISPDLCNDMHNCPVATGDKWLSETVPAILSSPAFTGQKSLLVITWDEGDNFTNHIAAIPVGPGAKHLKSSSHYNHYSLLRTIENNWSLKPLTGNDKAAPLMNEFMK